MNQNLELWVGLDIGSTTVKIAVVNPQDGQLIDSKYVRHGAQQLESARTLLQGLEQQFPNHSFRIALCGSGAAPLAPILGGHFIQEVVANSLAVRQLYSQTKVAIELGGQDAKVIFFAKDEQSGQWIASDMRMNGVCAGGTGAFIDQVAELLNIEVEEFDSYASQGNQVFEISGRCGVFAKTDIQPLLNQGVSKADIALSTFHAVAKQTIGGLAQGLEICAPVLFEGGPLNYCPTLIQVFRERLGLSTDQATLAQHGEVLVAWGAALTLGTLYAHSELKYQGSQALIQVPPNPELDLTASPFFQSPELYQDFLRRHHQETPQYDLNGIQSLEVYLGIDGGSTTTKFVLIDRHGVWVDHFYAHNEGEPLRILQNALIQMRGKYQDQGIDLHILGLGTTGYGEKLFAKALGADYHTVETVAHARAAQEICPEVSYILDIGGQDMKAISMDGGVVSGIILNEACSSGCGSFIETYARSLDVELKAIAPMAFASTSPSKLGSRCTVFMNSSIITQQRDGKSPGEILAGLCRSIIENVFTKVVRIRNMQSLGAHVVVQGGTFRNDAVLRAFEEYTGIQPLRPAMPGEMGAYGIALLTREKMLAQGQNSSSFIGLDALDDFAWQSNTASVCQFCSNHCSRTIVQFDHGQSFVTGHRCERGEITTDPKDPQTRAELRALQAKIQALPNMVRRQNRLLFDDFLTLLDETPLCSNRKIKIGIPRVLEFWSSMPFWQCFFSALGFEVVVSKPSSHALFERGLPSVPSDTVCFPAKLVHGHILDLVEQKVDRIFYPVMVSLPSEHKHFKATAVCPLIQGYPLIIKNSDLPEERFQIPLSQPTFHWTSPKLRKSQCIQWFAQHWKLPKAFIGEAVDLAEKAMQYYQERLQKEGAEILQQCQEQGTFAVVLGGRPYHMDPHVNHHLAAHFASLNIPVLTLESLPGVYDVDLPGDTRLETLNSYHCKLLAAAHLCAQNPVLELVQIVSFGCGHDASLSDEISRILHQNSDKDSLILKLDEGDVKGPLSLRVQSFVETVQRRRLSGVGIPKAPEPLFPVSFTEDDKAKRTILIPNLSPGFTKLAQSIFSAQGYQCVQLPLADTRAIELGKKFVHNDICFPAQINIGEALKYLEDHPQLDQEHLALGLAKNCENCRAGQYAALARKALDEAGYDGIPIVTTGKDTKGIHPGFKANLNFRLGMLWGMAMLDGMEQMVRRLRPYEMIPGQTQEVYDHFLPLVMERCAQKPKKGLVAFAEAIEAFNEIEIHNRSRLPRVGILGEILMKYHPAANGYVEEYLEKHGMEIIRPGMLDFFRRDEMIRSYKAKNGMLEKSFLNLLIGGVSSALYQYAARTVDQVFRKFRYYEKHADCYELVQKITDWMDTSYTTGEGWLIPAEISALAQEGVQSFVILQPFACLANHVSGRGMTKALKKRHPQIQILSLDYDPDTSFANIENRLQMLIINALELENRSCAHS